MRSISSEQSEEDRTMPFSHCALLCPWQKHESNPYVPPSWPTHSHSINANWFVTGSKSSACLLSIMQSPYPSTVANPPQLVDGFACDAASCILALHFALSLGGKISSVSWQTERSYINSQFEWFIYAPNLNGKLFIGMAAGETTTHKGCGGALNKCIYIIPIPFIYLFTGLHSTPKWAGGLKLSLKPNGH